jgi:hypothetical protein
VGGITDTQAINRTIFDFKNDFHLGNVTFIPFLTVLNSKAPTIPLSMTESSNSATPYPTSSGVPKIPEFPLFILTPIILMIITTLALLNDKGKQRKLSSNS